MSHTKGLQKLSALQASIFTQAVGVKVVSC